jgi:Transcription factor WhiB
MTVSRITAQVDSESVTQNRVSVREPYLLIYGARTDQDAWLRVIRDARCADTSLEADQRFSISAEAGQARREAAAAIAICTTYSVRAQCLAPSLRQSDIGQHGVWGGLVPAERAALRRSSWPA